MSVTSLRKYKKLDGYVSSAGTLTREGKKTQRHFRKFLQLWWWRSSVVPPDVCLILSWQLIAVMTQPTGDWALIKILEGVLRVMYGWKQRLIVAITQQDSQSQVTDSQRNHGKGRRILTCACACVKSSPNVNRSQEVQKCSLSSVPDYKLISLPRWFSNLAVKVVAHSNLKKDFLRSDLNCDPESLDLRPIFDSDVTTVSYKSWPWCSSLNTTLNPDV